MRTFLAVLAFVFVSLSGQAQDTIRVSPPATLEGDNDVTILYRNEASGGVTIHSNGWGVTFKSGKHVTGFKKRMLDFEIISMKHPKEYRITNPYEGANSFIYGKLNNVFLIRGGWGYQNILFSKGERSGVEIRLNYYLGIDLGVTKPVYLDILVNDPFNDSLRVPVTKRYDPNDPEQTIDNIYGSSSFFTGFDKMSIYPGGYGKIAFSFEHALWQRKIAAIEAGMMLDYFPHAIPIMAYNKYENVYFNFYLSFLWGGKW